MPYSRRAFLLKVAEVAGGVAIHGQKRYWISKEMKNLNPGQQSMPIVTINAVAPSNLASIRNSLIKVARVLAAALDTSPDHVWVYFLPISELCEGEKVPSQKEYHPVVNVLANPRPEDAIQRGLEAIASVIASEFSVDKRNVWIHWIDLPVGRVYAEGTVR